jgi:hypothetical protein
MLTLKARNIPPNTTKTYLNPKTQKFPRPVSPEMT